MDMIKYGWDNYFQTEYEKLGDDSLIPVRIIADYGQAVRVVTEDNEFLVDRHIHDGRAYGVGDFVCLEYDVINNRHSIKNILPRKTKFSRTAAGSVLKEQIVAANIDTVFIMQSLNLDFNLRRMERYLIAAWDSGALPVVVLTKKDLCDDADDKINEAYSVSAGADIFAISSFTGEGMDEVMNYIGFGKTVALLGSSGVGKSTFANTLFGEEILETKEVLRDDDRGRHTTTHRQLVLLPDGGMLLDTPGMRTLSMWDSEEGMSNLFSDIDDLAGECRFNDCRHISEPGCAVKKALEDGSLSEERWISYVKLKKEMAHLERRKSQKQRIQERQFSKMIKSSKKEVW